MPNSAPNAFDPVLLRSYLGEKLENSQFAEENVDAHYSPLLILEWTHVRAAFAFANGDLETSYRVLYQGFKHLYAQDRARWDALDRAFVFCVRPGTDDLDRFCSSVETDVYFCRKFVVALMDPIGKSLARLPFLPLNPIEGEHPLRPPSAQTLLRSYGVPAPLANVVVVPGQLSAERIVERCKESVFGQPTLRETRSVSRPSPRDRDREPVLIDSITIENFRAYRKPEVFELGSGVTVLYGPNGFGKTSFFDAVDFAFTGGIGRINERGARQLDRLARHLDSGEEESSVTVAFRNGGSSLRSVKRTVERANYADLDGRSVDRKAVLRILTGGTSDGSENIGNLISLFRASHLFSQEQQELTKDFKNDSLPKETVSRMLAFEDYASATTKLQLVCGLLRSSLAKASDDEKARRAEIDLAKRELAGYRVRIERNPDGQGLTKAMSDLRARLVELKLAQPDAELTPADLRRLRGELELLLSESDATTARLTDLKSIVPRLAPIAFELDASVAKAELLEREVSAARERLAKVEQEGRALSDDLAKVVAARSSSQGLVDAINWCRAAKIRQSQLISARAKAAGDVSVATASVDKLIAEADAGVPAAESISGKLQILARRSEDLQRQRRTLEALAERAAVWRSEQRLLEVATQVERDSAEGGTALQAEARDFRRQLAEIEAEQGKLSRELERIDLTTTEFRRLLIDVQSHITSGECPVCGASHPSKEELLRRVELRLDGDPASKQRGELSRMREHGQALGEALARNADAQKRLADATEQAKRERAELASSISAFAGAAEGVGIVVSSPLTVPEDEIESRIASVAAEHKSVSDQRVEVGRGAEVAQARAIEIKALIATKKAELASSQTTLERLAGDIRELENDQLAQLVPLATDGDLLDARERRCHDEISRLDADRTALEATLADRRVSFTAAKAAFDAVGRDLQGVRAAIAALQTERSQIEAAARAASIAGGASTGLIAARIAEEAARRVELASVRGSASAVETAIDTATTAASHDRLRRDIESKEKELSDVTAAKGVEQPWLDYFQRIAKLVSSQQSKAIAAFTTEYGPRASTIQRRLRPVYGFDDVEVRSEDSSIAVRVRRGNDELHPTEYFSQSQVQTLLLSLFLTACVSQTWSSLSPIFLDDPVTHFDDLNTYAFLDLVVGLLEVEGQGRQFVLSTCDEKFLQLARQKFRHLGEAAKFYQFSAIGADGPVVAKLG